MEPVAPLVMIGALVSLVAWLLHDRGTQRLAAWRAALGACGVRDVRDSDSWSGGLEGSADGLRVRLALYNRGKYAQGLRLVIEVGQPGDLDLRRENLFTAIEKQVLGQREIEIGDPAFDDLFLVGGRPVVAHALLDAPARAGLLSVADRRERFDLRVGELTCDFDRPVPDDLAAVLRTALGVAQSLARSGDLGARLAENARRDPRSEARLRCLRLLAREFPDDEPTRAALLAARSDADPRVCLEAALALGADGHDTLRRLARHPMVDQDLAARAIEGLGAAFPAASARELLASSAAAGRVEVARACLASLAARPDEATLPALVALLRASSSSLAAAAADALGALAVPAAEPELVEALRHEDEGVTASAARALGALGSIAAVPALRQLEGNAQRRDTRRAARQAVAAIQSRAPGATPGQLSLAASEAGQLALADDERGAVALADDEEGGRG